MNIRLNVNSIINSIAIAFIYFFFDRSLNLYIISSNSTVASIYTLISQVTFILICLYFMTNRISSNRVLYYNSDKIILIFIVFAGTMLFSTFINDGNIRRWFSSVYPTIGSLLFMSVCFKDLERAKKFINAISNLYFFLLAINLILMIFLPNQFGANHYFVSIKNQIAIPLTMGFFFIYLDSYLNSNKIKLYLYIIIHITTSIFVFSSGGLICMAFIYLCIFAKPIGRFLKSLQLSYIIIFFSVILLFIISGSISVLLNLPIVKYIIVDIFGKNLTLTNRVFIWEKLKDMLSGHFILGMGVADTYNLFNMNKTFTNRIAFVGTYSAHNQFLQTLYEGGIISLVIMLMAAVVVSMKLTKVSDATVNKVIKIAIIAIIIVLFDEAAGYIAYFQIIQLGYLMVHGINKDNVAKI